jgi:hypothetical protein
MGPRLGRCQLCGKIYMQRLAFFDDVFAVPGILRRCLRCVLFYVKCAYGILALARHKYSPSSRLHVLGYPPQLDLLCTCPRPDGLLDRHDAGCSSLQGRSLFGLGSSVGSPWERPPPLIRDPLKNTSQGGAFKYLLGTRSRVVLDSGK